MKAPTLKNNEHSVLVAELNTGIVLTVEFKRHLGNGEAFHIFNTYELALEFVDKKLSEFSNMEFSIYDSNGKHIVTKDFNGNR